MRRVMDQNTAITNGLANEDRTHLAAAMESGRYLLFVGYIDKEQAPNDVQWRYHAMDFPDNVIRESPSVLLHHLGDAERTFHKREESRINHAIPDVGE